MPKKFAVMAAVCSYIGEGFRAEVLEDSRVASRWQELHDCVWDEMRHVTSISEQVWGFLGCACATPLVSLRSQAMSAAHTSLAFVQNRVLIPASQAPWNLCRGDLLANLQSLSVGEEPGEPTSRKMWTLMRSGYNGASWPQAWSCCRVANGARPL